MKATVRVIFSSIFFWLAIVSHLGQAQTASKDNEFFEAKIRPVLIQNCYQCHSTDKKAEAGLRLDSKAGWQLGGDSGTAITAGDVSQSLLIQRIQSEDVDLVMPPKNSGLTLSKAQIDDLVSWVQAGAFDPREESALAPTTKNWEAAFRERLDWWSLRPVRSVEPPTSNDTDWSQNAIDRFLIHSMNQRGIEPSTAAEPSELLRRAYLVLTGLPPSSSQVELFSRLAPNEFSAAYEQLIDNLLASEHYGERFARHWLDVIRFSETHGNEWNYDIPYAWRYRDYAIRAFNADVPFDRFVREHIAGDLLTTRRSSPGVAFDQSPLGTALFRFGEVNHDSCTQFPVIGYDILDNQLDTLTKAFQATTAACARCHDHKLDAISQRDYYSLLAILRSSRPVMRTLDDLQSQKSVTEQLSRLKTEIRKLLAVVWRSDLKTFTASKFDEALKPKSDKPHPLEDPAHLWNKLNKVAAADFGSTWDELAKTLVAESMTRDDFNRKSFTTLADFREQVPDKWHVDGHGLQQGVSAGGQFVVAAEGENAIKSVLPAGLMTFSISARQNGAMRSPNLNRTHAKVSFEVIGGRFSLARLVFNNCQFNYDRQHSIHHDTWSWITIDWPEKAEALNPFIELLTFWDNPKFPDPLGTLGKDIELQREPYDVHAKDPRSWWGIRRIVVHDGAETPKASVAHLQRLFSGESPQSLDDLVKRFREVASNVVERFDAGNCDDDDVAWLDWLIRSESLSNKKSSDPQLEKLIANYRALESSLPRPTTYPAIADEGLPVAQAVFVRGDLQKPRDSVDRGYLRMLAPDGLSVSPSSSGRRELAEAIASPNNPLTGRVIVNRVWQWVFGRGLVGTPDDFGHLGEAPLHPELLDHLSAQFVADGWSIKQLVRTLVLSRAFRSSGRPTASAIKLDPDNHSFSHYTARRAEAEVIRDSLLSVSGRIDLRMFGPSVHPYRTAADNEKRLYVGPLDGDGRRSIYIKFQLMEQPAFLRVFNLPGGKVTEGRRGTTNTVEQSLAMLNDPLVLMLAEKWAESLIQDGSPSSEARLALMFRKALSREPTQSELERFRSVIDQLAANHSINPESIPASREIWREVALTVFNLQEFRYIP